MAYSGGFLYASGGLLVLATVLLPSWDLYAPDWVAGVGGVAIAVGAFFLWAAERLPMPLWQYAVATSLGAVLVTVAAIGGGPQTTATYGILYVFVSAYGFFYYPWPIAAWLVVLSGTGFALALTWHDVQVALVQWIVVVVGTVIAGGLVGTLGKRVRRLLDLEQASLEELQELDEWKTTFLRAVAHDLRSPLASMLGLLGLVRDRLDLPREQQHELVARSIGAGERLQRLIDNLLDLQRIEAGDVEARIEVTALRQLVLDTVSTLELAGRRVHFDVEGLTAMVEPSKVERIVTNLVGNALRHTPQDAQVWVRLHEDAGMAVFTVEDDGPGLPSQLRDDPFGAFVSGRQNGSVGLGLHLVGRFVELHSGTVQASERPGGGTSIEVRLPLAPAGTPRTPQERRTRQPDVVPSDDEAEAPFRVPVSRQALDELPLPEFSTSR